MPNILHTLKHLHPLRLSFYKMRLSCHSVSFVKDSILTYPIGCVQELNELIMESTENNILTHSKVSVNVSYYHLVLIYNNSFYY